jgi:hypothetical protein
MLTFARGGDTRRSFEGDGGKMCAVTITALKRKGRTSTDMGGDVFYEIAKIVSKRN